MAEPHQQSKEHPDERAAFVEMMEAAHDPTVPDERVRALRLKWRRLLDKYSNG